jgi:PST family polysaccharide transporter
VPHAASAFKWSLLGELASRLIGPVVFLALARLLTPSDFGVVAAAMLVVGFSQAVAEAGLGKALVQRRDRLEDAADAAFWCNLAIASAVALLLVAAAPAIADYFREPRVAAVTRVLALQLPLAALCAIPTALLQRDLSFRELFHVRLLTAGIPALLSVPMAVAGMSYWALVAGALGGQALQAIVLWRRGGWRPRRGFDRRLAAELLHFGKWAMLSGLLAWFYTWMDAVVVARWLGAHDMGLYRIGTSFVTMVFGVLFAPLLPVLYSLFSRVGHDPPAVAGALSRAVAGIALLALPIGALLVLAADAIEATLFGPGWSGLAPIVALMAASQALAWLVGANGEAYRAIGRPNLETRVMAISAGVYLVAYLVAIRYGLLVFVATRALLVVAGIALQLWIARVALGLRMGGWLAAAGKPLLFTAAGFVAAWWLPQPAEAQWQNALIRGVVFAVVYAGLVVAFDRERLESLRRALHAP